jgi:hypothetical protein
VDPHIVNLLFKPLEPPKSQLLGPSWIEPVYWRSTIDPSHLLPAFKDLSEHIGKHPVIWKKFYTNDDHKAPLAYAMERDACLGEDAHHQTPQTWPLGDRVSSKFSKFKPLNHLPLSSLQC